MKKVYKNLFFFISFFFSFLIIYLPMNNFDPYNKLSQRENSLNMTRSLVQAADLFLCCAKELESAFQASNDSSKKILYNLVNRFDRLGALMSIIKSMKHPDSSFHYVQKEKEERIVMVNTDDLDRPVIEEGAH